MPFCDIINFHNLYLRVPFFLPNKKRSKKLRFSVWCGRRDLRLCGAPVPQDNARRGRYSLSKGSSALKNYYNALPYELGMRLAPGFVRYGIAIVRRWAQSRQQRMTESKEGSFIRALHNYVVLSLLSAHFLYLYKFLYTYPTIKPWFLLYCKNDQ